MREGECGSVQAANESRPRSLWHWGYTDRFPSEKSRRETADDVASLLQLETALPLLPLPRPEDARVPAPRITVPPALAAFASAEPLDRAMHTYGRGYPDLVRAFGGDFAPAPDFVAHARDERDVVALLAWAAPERVAVVPYGGGTSVVGGVEGDVGPAWRGVVSLDLRAMDRVLEVDAVSLLARIQAGATLPRLEEQLAPHGLTLRHYPQSYEFATLGGCIATRSGGHFATATTRIDDFVASLRMVTPTGVWQTARVPSSGAGPDPNALAMGSEGILGVITEAWVRVHRRPRYRAKATVRFEDFESGVAAARAIAQSRLYPANCRLLDAQESLLHRVGVQPTLLLAFESADAPQNGPLDQALALARAAGGEADAVRASGPEASDSNQEEAADSRWRRAFLDAPYLQSALVSVGVLADTFETSVTWDRFPRLHAAIVEAVEGALRRECGAGVVSCRFTHVYPDGPAPYYTFVGPARAGGEVDQWRAVKQVASDTLAAHGATITHHHAVGRVHRPWYVREAPERFRASLRAVKRELDPAGVLNPGILLPEE